MQTYGYFKDGEIVAPVAMCSRFNDIGAWHTLSDEERAFHGWYPCIIEQDTFNPSLQYKGTPQFEFIGDVIYCRIAVFDKEVSTVKKELYDSLDVTVDTLLSAPIVIEGYVFTLAVVNKLSQSLKTNNKEVYLDNNGQVLKLTRDSVGKILVELVNFEQSVLKFKYEIQNRLTQSSSIEELLDIDIQGMAIKVLEN